MIIALSGYGGAGKDSVADVLVEDYGFIRYAWADTLRMAASALNPIVHVDMDGTIVRYNDAVSSVGYNEAKFLFPEVRNSLQRLGTEVGRELIGDTVWVDATFNRINRDGNLAENIVITDTRFKNEAHAIQARHPVAAGGRTAFVVRVNRPGIGPAGDHISEVDLDDYPFDYVIDNRGDLMDLRVAVSGLYDFARNAA